MPPDNDRCTLNYCKNGYPIGENDKRNRDQQMHYNRRHNKTKTWIFESRYGNLHTFERDDTGFYQCFCKASFSTSSALQTHAFGSKGEKKRPPCEIFKNSISLHKQIKRAKVNFNTSLSLLSNDAEAIDTILEEVEYKNGKKNDAIPSTLIDAVNMLRHHLNEAKNNVDRI